MEEQVNTHQATLEENPKQSDLDFLGKGIQEYNIECTGESTDKNQLTYFVRDLNNSIIAGIVGNYNKYGWLYINGLWVADNSGTRG
jgi:hypothetical protein